MSEISDRAHGCTGCYRISTLGFGVVHVNVLQGDVTYTLDQTKSMLAAVRERNGVADQCFLFIRNISQVTPKN